MTYPDDEVTPQEVLRDAYVIAEYLDLLRFLAETGVLSILPHIPWALYQEGVRAGRHWQEVLEDLGLPVPSDWGW